MPKMKKMNKMKVDVKYGIETTIHAVIDSDTKFLIYFTHGDAEPDYYLLLDRTVRSISGSKNPGEEFSHCVKESMQKALNRFARDGWDLDQLSTVKIQSRDLNGNVLSTSIIDICLRGTLQNMCKAIEQELK